MLALPQTAEYALRAVSFIAEHESNGPVPVSAVAESLRAPQNYLSKTLNQLSTLGILRSVRGVYGGYLLGAPAGEIRLAAIVAPYLAPTEHRCIMGRTRCRDDAPCGAHWRWKQVRDVTSAFFADLTVGDLLSPPADLTVNDLLREAPAAAAVLNRLGIDTCCGGSLSLAEAAASVGLETPALLAELRHPTEAA